MTEQSDATTGRRAPTGIRSRTLRTAVSRAAIALLLCWARAASAQTDEIQVYDAGITGTGTLNLTWHNNYTPSGSRTPQFTGGLVAEHSLNGVTEWAYGVTDWFEAGLYVPLYSVSRSGALTYNGFKVRTLFVVPDAASRQFFYGVNFEYSGNTRHWDPHRFTSEVRPIVGWRFGPVDLIVNPILDYYSAGVSGLDFAPASRLALHLSRDWTVAAEEYADFGPLRRLLPAQSQSQQLFAVVDHAIGKTELEAGAGFGLTRSSDGLVLKLILSRDIN